jgi:hypothetical protein
MNVSQIALYLLAIQLGSEQTQKWMKGMLDLAILGKASWYAFTLPFMLMAPESSRMHSLSRAIVCEAA